MPIRFLVPLLIAVLVALMPAAAQAKRVALVIGNSTYQSAPSLANPGNDASDIAATLREVGFDVTHLRDVSVSAFDQALLSFIDKAQDAEVALFFYAGHGLQIYGRSFLMPVDARLENEASALRELMAVQDIVSKIENAARISIIVLDACRDNPLADQLRRRVRAENRDVKPAQGLAPVSVKGSNTLVVYATVPGEVAADGVGRRNSPFTASLLNHVKTPGLEVELMFKRVTADVLKATNGKQQPERLSRLQTEVVLRAAGSDALPKQETALTDKAPEQASEQLTYEDKSQRLVRSFAGDWKAVNSVVFLPDGRFALSGGCDSVGENGYTKYYDCLKGSLKLWEVGTGKERNFMGHSAHISAVAVSPDGRLVLSGSEDATLKLWEVSTGNELRSFVGHSGWVNSVAFSPDGRLALSGSQDQTLKLWEVGTGKEVRSFTTHSRVNSVSFSPDGRLALSGSGDLTLKLWDVGTGNELRSFTGHSNEVLSVAFSPDGRFALSGSEDNTIKLWEVGTGKALRSFAAHSSWVVSVAFSPDGRFALSGSVDKTLKLWDVGTGNELRSFTGHVNGVLSVAFSPDGRFALSGGYDKILILWDVSEWTAPQSVQPAPLAQTTKPARQDNEPSGTVFKPIIQKD